ncbi:MAG: hypothetical protein H0V70_30405 [Ktedonobacteraceae bacterium]|nr:hypothetical protein [Ktedonobacteraceae bacterium]
MAIPALLFLTEKEWDELKRACKERAGWRCEYIYPSGKRCTSHEGQTIWRGEYIVVNGKPQKKITIRHVHGCHTGNDPENHNPILECRCPRHHTEVDRKNEKAEKPSWYRRGYQITTTDKLLEEVNARGVRIEEQEDGYHWRISGREDDGKCTTAVGAVGAVILDLSYLLEIRERELQAISLELAQLRQQSQTFDEL